MRVAVYGGSFNPPHVAHAMVAAWARWTGQVDEVWLVPVYHHAFEGLHGKELAPFETRLAWCEALAEDVGRGVRVSAIERDLPVPSYTIQTLRTLRDRHPEHVFRLIAGADVLPQVQKWRDWPVIEAEFSPIIVGREGHASPPDVLRFPDISSTALRERLARGEDLSAWVTQGVARLLRDFQP